MTPFEKFAPQQETTKKILEKSGTTKAFDLKKIIFRETAEFREPGNEKEGEEVREIIFQEIIFSKILPDFVDDLKRMNLGGEVINEFINLIKEQKERNIVNSILATPAENRPKIIRVVIQENIENKPEIKNNPKNLAEAIFWSIAEISQEVGRYIGYHNSNQEILKKELPDGNIRFDVEGVEMDEREQNMPMAFCATTYKDLYREKNPRYLYVVSGLLDYRIDDRIRNWMRAPKLSGVSGPYLIEEIDLAVEKHYKSVIDKNKER